MTLARLEVADFRCIERADIALHPRLTVVTGANGSGKTSLLESIFFLSCGRSFRTHRLQPLIRAGSDAAAVVGRVVTGHREVVLGARATRAGGVETRAAGRDVRGFEEHARYLPVQVIDPDIHKVLEEGPIRRRRYLDWGVFHVEHLYLREWRRYQRALKQRNAALRSNSPWPEVRLWDRELSEAGELVSDARSRYLDRLRPVARQLVANLLGVELELLYQRGWPADLDLAKALQVGRVRDQQTAITHVGPHRADVRIRIDGSLAKERISRGQQKLLAAALVLAQLTLRDPDDPAAPLLLIDDPAAELDGESLDRLLEQLRVLDAQLVVTALEPARISALAADVMFHVEQGQVAQML
jgi:DNA replication and repair protein RecF